MTRAERRAWPRSPWPPNHVGRTACVRPGRDVSVLDLSRGGALIEGRARLAPNSRIELRLTAPGRVMHLTGRVVRCYVSALNKSIVSYQAGVAFEQSLDLSQFELESSD